MPRKPRTSAEKNAGTNLSTSTVKSLERHKRFKQIEELLAEQYTGGQIVRHMMKEHGLQERQCYLDLSEVYARCQADDARDHDVRMSKARLAWGRRLRMCESAGEQQAANYALDRICKLEGLYAPKKIELTQTTATVNIQITALVGVLDAAGLAALELVQQQIEAARQRGLLPAADDLPGHDVVDVEENLPA